MSDLLCAIVCQKISEIMLFFSKFYQTSPESYYERIQPLMKPINHKSNGININDYSHYDRQACLRVKLISSVDNQVL